MQNSLVGLIPAAGEGTRISPLPGSKELFPIGFRETHVGDEIQLRPKVISQYLVDNMHEAGVQKIYTVLARGKTDIMDYFGSSKEYGCNIAYLLDNNVRGMPYTLDVAWPWVQEHTVLFGMPDTIFTPADTFSQLLAKHRDKNADLTLGIFPTQCPEKLCPVRLDASDRILTMTDKPPHSDIMNTWGCAVWGAGFSEFMHRYLEASVPNDGETCLADVFLTAIDEGLSVFGHFFSDGEYIDIGTPIDLVVAVRRFSKTAMSVP